MLIDQSLSEVQIGFPSPPETASSLSVDARLQASRRLDWRFLLPEPSLGKTAYVGTGKGSLLPSLRLFSSALSEFTRPVEGLEKQPPFDLVVCQDPGLQVLLWAARTVRQGGYLYLETYRLRVPGKPSRSGKTRTQGRIPGSKKLRSLLGAQGYEDFEFHWHWPDFEVCTRILPLGEKGVLRFAWTSGTGRPRWKAALADLLDRSGVLNRWAPCTSLLTRRGQG